MIDFFDFLVFYYTPQMGNREILPFISIAINLKYVTEFLVISNTICSFFAIMTSSQSCSEDFYAMLSYISLRFINT